jgi:TolB-like protein
MALAPAGLDRAGGAVDANPTAAEISVPAREARLAVLPFENLDGDKDAPSLRGIEEQVIDRLANTPGLRVTGRTVASVLGSEAGLADARRRLGLSHLLEGSLRAEGATLRVSIRLLRAQDGTQIWSERFDLPAQNAETAENIIATAVASRIRARLSQGSING